MDKITLLQQTELFVLDMDGTYYLGDRILPGARDFLDAVTAAGKDWMFFTNNSSRSPGDYIEKLARMDTPVTPERIMTSGDVMISFLQAEHPDAAVYLCGTPALFQSFDEAGIRLVNRERTPSDQDSKERPDLVVLGFDQTLTYERLTEACSYIRQGVGFLATHPDINCPVEGGFIPDCGAIIACISLSTGVKPRITGKPYPETVDAVLRRAGKLKAGGSIDRRAVTFVGDRLYTDIATGVKNGARGALVLTGETKQEDIPQSEVQPDAIYASLGEMGELLKKMTQGTSNQ
ncbi:MAG: HAD-IIA family hydrolase [Lachnospiraceae bacterium]|nr:HAD-IIA family hydrolase [Lachnospiraceae bacterium]